MFTLLDKFLCAVACVLWICWRYSRNGRYNLRKWRHPPGPRGLPIIGNLINLPSQLSWLQFDRWSRDYGMSFVQRRINGHVSGVQVPT